MRLRKKRVVHVIVTKSFFRLGDLFEYEMSKLAFAAPGSLRVGLMKRP